MTDLKDLRVAILVADMFEQVELTEPRRAPEDAGASIEILSIEDGEVQSFNHYDKADTVRVDRTVEEASADDYDALMLPGGVGNPDNLRQDENAVRFVRGLLRPGEAGGRNLPRPVAADRGRRRPRPQAHVVPEPRARVRALPPDERRAD